MLKDRFKERIKAKEALFGLWLPFPSPELVEFLGFAGFDYVLIDAEHYAFGVETTQALARAAEYSGMVPLARVPKLDHELILTYMETGVRGIMVPHVNTVEEARAAVVAVKYPPLGTRGAGSGTRAANWGLTQTATQYFTEVNDQTVVMVLVEEEEGFRNLPEILKVEGLDGVSTGPGDLSLSMGFPGQSGHPRVRALIEPAEEMIRNSDKGYEDTVSSLEQARKARAAGSRFITLGFGSALGGFVRDFLKQAKA